MTTETIKAFVKHGNWMVSVVVVVQKGHKKAQYTFIHRALNHSLGLLNYKRYIVEDDGTHKLVQRWSRASMPDYPNTLNFEEIPQAKKIKEIALSTFINALKFKPFTDAKNGPMTNKLRKERERKNEQRPYTGKRKAYKKSRYRKRSKRKSS